MDDKIAKLAGAKVFHDASKYISDHGWDHNSMDILLKVSGGKVWPQPMAVLMFSELEHALGSQTLTQFDQVASTKEVVELFKKVIKGLEN